MLAQHMITKPVFEALFADFSFAQLNPMSKAMQGVLDVLEQHYIDKEADTLQRFYDSVKMRASGIDNAQGKQKIVVELYDKFFRNAFPRMTERLASSIRQSRSSTSSSTASMMCSNPSLARRWAAMVSTSSTRSRGRARSSRGCCSRA